MQIIIFMVLLTLVTYSLCHREHKVHNIVLYPDKQSWCKTTPIKQVVGEPGYESSTVENSVCVGTCFSYSIPHTSDITITPYCDSCQPSETHWFHITLRKLANADEELSEYPNQDVSTPLPETIQKQIQIITNCTCLSCTEQLNNQKNFFHDNTTELPKSLLADNNKKTVHDKMKLNWDKVENNSIDNDDENSDNNSENNNSNENSNNIERNVNNVSPAFEIPELLQLVNRTNSRSKNTYKLINDSNITADANTDDQHRYYLNTHLVNLLKNIQNNSQHDDAIPTENNFNFDKKLLSELLQIIEGSENNLNDKNLMEFVNFVNVHNSDDFELDLSRLKTVLTQYESEKLKDRHRQFGLGVVNNQQIQYAPLKQSDDSVVKHHHHHHHYTGEHINLTLDPDDKTNQHLIGGHLVAGPHGSLVVQPDSDDLLASSSSTVDEKINMDPNLLRPNHEGTVINYENHVKDKHKTIED